jgi:hypothetical protein
LQIPPNGVSGFHELLPHMQLLRALLSPLTDSMVFVNGLLAAFEYGQRHTVDRQQLQVSGDRCALLKRQGFRSYGRIRKKKTQEVVDLR